MSLGRIVGPAWAGFAFDISASLPYLTGALVFGIGFVMSALKTQPTLDNAQPAP